MDVDFDSPLVVGFFLTGTVLVGASIRTLLRHPWLNIPSGLYAILITFLGVDPAKAGGHGIPAYALGLGFAALAFWRSWRAVKRRRERASPSP